MDSAIESRNYAFPPLIDVLLFQQYDHAISADIGMEFLSPRIQLKCCNLEADNSQILHPELHREKSQPQLKL
jgi:hypothetical protein